MLNNLSIKSRLIFVIGFLLVALVAIGAIGLSSLSATNASFKTVYEDRLVAMGYLDEISAHMNSNQMLLAESVIG
ncbi:MAG: MCP four helix bundle domain-containing protein, partial [Gammaproteobacteria bacterium]|nr:MCP four helix bundle domain-containing protein [Gammaproteobacteria bacterium]